MKNIDINKEFSFVILAGGKGSRMNFADKSALKYDEERTFLEKICSEAAGFQEVIISKNRPLDTNELERVFKILTEINNIKNFKEKGVLRVVEDIYRDCGPLSGIYSSMLISSREYIFLTTCDTPNLNREFIKFMIDEYSSEYDAMIVKDIHGKLHPLCGIYKKTLADKISEQLKNGDFKILNLFKTNILKVLEIPEEKFSSEIIMENFNFPEDLRKLV